MSKVESSDSNINLEKKNELQEVTVNKDLENILDLSLSEHSEPQENLKNMGSNEFSASELLQASSEASEAHETENRGTNRTFDSKEGTLGRLNTMHGVDEIWEHNSSVLVPKWNADSESVSPKMDTESSATFTESDNEDSGNKNYETDDSMHSTASESFGVADGLQVTPSMLSSPSRLNEVQNLLSQHKVALEKEKCKNKSLKLMLKTLTKEKIYLNRMIQSLQHSNGQLETELLKINGELCVLQYRNQEQFEENKTLAVLMEEIKLQLENKHDFLEKNNEEKQQLENDKNKLSEELETRMMKMQEKFDVLKEEHEQSIDKLNIRLADISEENISVKSLLEEKKILEAQLTSEKAYMENNIQELNMQVSQLTQENSSLKSELEEHSKRSEMFLEEKLSFARTETQQEKEYLNIQIDELTKEKEKLFQELTQKMKELEIKSELENETEQLLETFKQQVADLRKDNELLKCEKEAKNENEKVWNEEFLQTKTDMENQLKKAAQENDILRKQLEERNETCKKIEAETESKIELLNSQLSELQQENQMLKTELAESEKQFKKFEENEKMKLEKINSQLSEIKEENDILRIKLEENDKNKVLESENYEMQQQVQLLNSQLMDMKQVNDAYKVQLQENTENIKKHEQEKAEVQQVKFSNLQLDKIKQENDILNIKLEEMTKKCKANEAIEHDFQSLKLQMDEVKQQNVNLEAKLMENSSKQVEGKEKIITQQQMELLVSQLHSVKNENASLKAASLREEKHGGSGDMVPEKVKLDEQIELLNTQLEDLKQKNSDLNMKMEELTLSQERLMMEKICQSKSEMNDQIENLTSQLTVMNKENNDLQKRIEQLAENRSGLSKQEMEHFLSTLRIHIDEINQKNLILRNELEENNRTQKKLKEKSHQSNVEVKHHLEKLVQQMSDLAMEHRHLKLELQDHNLKHKHLEDRSRQSSDKDYVTTIKIREEESREQLSKIVAEAQNQLTVLKEDCSHYFLQDMQKKLENQIQDVVKQNSRIEQAIKTQGSTLKANEEEWKDLKRELSHDRYKYVEFLERQAAAKIEEKERVSITAHKEDLLHIKDYLHHSEQEPYKSSNVAVALQNKEKLDSLASQVEVLKSKMEIDKDLHNMAEMYRADMSRHHMEHINRINQLENQLQSRTNRGLTNAKPLWLQENSFVPLVVTAQKDFSPKELVQQNEFAEVRNRLMEEVACLRSELAADRERTEVLVREVGRKNQVTPSKNSHSFNDGHTLKIDAATRSDTALPKWLLSPVDKSTTPPFRLIIESKLDETFKNMLQSTVDEVPERESDATYLRTKFLL